MGLISLTDKSKKAQNIKDIKRVEYFDSRYYKVLYEQTEKAIGKKKPTKQLIEEHLISVTEVLGAYPHDFLERWRGDVGNDRADQIIRDALNLGSIIHYGAEVLAKQGAVVYNPYANPLYTEAQITAFRKKYKELCVVRFQREFLQLTRIHKWFEVVKPQDVQSEQTVFSIKHKYAGTADMFCYIEEGEYMIAGSLPLWLPSGWYVCDYKTGKGVSITYKMQLAAYINAIRESNPEYDIVGGLIIHPNNEQIQKGIEGLKTTAILQETGEVDRFFKNFLSVYDVYKIEHPTPNPKEFSMPSILELSFKKGKSNAKRRP